MKSSETPLKRSLTGAAIACLIATLFAISSAHSKQSADSYPRSSESKHSERERAESKNSESKSSETKSSETKSSDAKSSDAPQVLTSSFYVTSDYNKSTIDEVDKIISKELYSAKLSRTVWPEAVKEHRNEIIKSQNLAELSASVGKAVAALKSSHCQFVTANDETYHFLHALFGSFNKKLRLGKSDFTGFATGSLDYADNQVRYVLDDSPASKAGIIIGDKIVSVNGHKYFGYSNFAGTAGAMQKLVIERDGKTINVNLKPEKSDFYDAYIDAMKKSAKVLKHELDDAGKHADGKHAKKRSLNIGYVHVWCGGSDSHDALDEVMEEKLADTDGLIFDLRDGYGGNGLEDLDRFYRAEHAFPTFKTTYRDGKVVNYKYYYDKPIVAIINNGSRSGKELLAFSLKRTGRARLVGGTTAGAVLGGRLFPINDRASLYLAIFDGTIGGVRIEGTGVSPDVEVLNTDHTQAGADKQFQVAAAEIVKLITSK